MLNLFKWFGKKKSNPPYTEVLCAETPFHITQFGKMFPISTKPGNRSIGEIKFLRFSKPAKDIYPGQFRITKQETGNDPEEIWVYLGYDFYKLIFKR